MPVSKLEDVIKKLREDVIKKLREAIKEIEGDALDGGKTFVQRAEDYYNAIQEGINHMREASIDKLPHDIKAIERAAAALQKEDSILKQDILKDMQQIGEDVLKRIKDLISNVKDVIRDVMEPTAGEASVVEPTSEEASYEADSEENAIIANQADKTPTPSPPKGSNSDDNNKTAKAQMEEINRLFKFVQKFDPTKPLFMNIVEEIIEHARQAKASRDTIQNTGAQEPASQNYVENTPSPSPIGIDNEDDEEAKKEKEKEEKRQKALKEAQRKRNQGDDNIGSMKDQSGSTPPNNGDATTAFYKKHKEDQSNAINETGANAGDTEVGTGGTEVGAKAGAEGAGQAAEGASKAQEAEELAEIAKLALI